MSDYKFQVGDKVYNFMGSYGEVVKIHDFQDSSLPFYECLFRGRFDEEPFRSSVVEDCLFPVSTAIVQHMDGKWYLNCALYVAFGSMDEAILEAKKILGADCHIKVI